VALYYTILALFFITGSFIEFWLTRKEHNKYYCLNDFKSNLQLMFVSLLIDMVIKAAAIYLLIILYNYSLFQLGYQWWVWILCYLGWDLIFYLKHYMEHNVRFMWAIHVNHHSSTYMNLSTSLRSGVFKSGYRYLFWAIIIFIGFPVPMFLILYGLGKVWAFFSHSQKLGNWHILEKFTITPTHHLLHHSCNEDNLNKNFGETFLFWDKLFGTFKQTSKQLKYGINESLNHTNFRNIVFHEFINMKNDLREARGWKRKVKIIFGRPGTQYS
jgi:alkylglycerol monooxygenase